MKIQKTIRLLSLVLILQMFISVIFVSSIEKNKQLNYSINSTTIKINDFSNFQILYDEPELSSVKTDSHLNFTYNGGSSELSIMRYYYLPLTNYGDCTDFDIQVSIDYDFTGSLHYGRFEMIIGSFYNESGEYCGVPNGTVIGYPHLPAMVLSKCNVVDAWSDSGGEFRVFAYPNDIYEIYHTERGSTGTAGIATFKMTRDNNTLYCQVKQGGITQIDHTWYNNVTKSANFILIGEGIDGSVATFASASFYDFSATFVFPDQQGIIGPHLGVITIVSFTGLVILIFINRKAKKE
ncbi:MAG: hypothetical protein FK733_14375 [Asgard group archaeon]|nr:hypothetical protein [Asgard group archaeon]